MSKSIQRAIREHVAPDQYTMSPLDLRMSPVVRRSTIDKRPSPSERNSNRLSRTVDESRTPEMAATNRKRRSIELRSGSILETVYEMARTTDTGDEENQNQKETDYLLGSPSKEKALAASKSNASSDSANLPITETPAGAAKSHANENDDHESLDVWYTPCESIPTKPIDNTEVDWLNDDFDRHL